MIGIDFRAIADKFGWKVINDYLEKLYFKEKLILYNVKSKGKADVRKVFNVTAEGEVELDNEIKKYGWKNLTNDSKVQLISYYVNKRLRYVQDKYNYGANEYWADPYTLWEKRTDDCDGFAVLICYLCWRAGVPRERLRLKTGYIYYPSGKKGGHAYVEYIAERDNIAYTVEGSWYPSEAKERWNKRLPHTSSDRYGKTWWYTTDEKSFVRK